MAKPPFLKLSNLVQFWCR